MCLLLGRTAVASTLYQRFHRNSIMNQCFPLRSYAAAQSTTTRTAMPCLARTADAYVPVAEQRHLYSPPLTEKTRRETYRVHAKATHHYSRSTPYRQPTITRILTFATMVAEGTSYLERTAARKIVRFSLWWVSPRIFGGVMLPEILEFPPRPKPFNISTLPPSLCSHILMETDQESRKRKLAALKERRAQSNLANTALVKDEDARWVSWSCPICTSGGLGRRLPPAGRYLYRSSMLSEVRSQIPLRREKAARWWL